MWKMFEIKKYKFTTLCSFKASGRAAASETLSCSVITKSTAGLIGNLTSLRLLWAVAVGCASGRESDEHRVEKNDVKLTEST